jgi:hypothetical protein
MSEKDIKLGGMAATKFAATNKGAYQDSNDLTYKNSDDVRDHYLRQFSTEEQGEKQSDSRENGNISSLPLGWSERQRIKEMQAKQQGVFAAQKDVPSPPVTSPAVTTTLNNNELPSSMIAEAALLQVTTHSLECLATVLENRNNGKTAVSVCAEERRRFASALKRAMDALAKCR